MKDFKIYTDVFGTQNTAAIGESDEIFYRDLVPFMEILLNPPEGARFVLFQYFGDKFYVIFNSDTPLTVPASGDSSSSVMTNPDIRYLGDSVDSIRIISPDTGRLVVSYYG